MNDPEAQIPNPPSGPDGPGAPGSRGESHSFSLNWLEKYCPGLVRDIEFWSQQGKEQAEKQIHSSRQAGTQDDQAYGLVNCAVCGRLGPLPEAPEGTMAGMVVCNGCAQTLDEAEIVLLQAGFEQGVKIGIELQCRHDAPQLARAQVDAFRLAAEARWLRKSEQQVVEIARAECKRAAKALAEEQQQVRYWKKAWVWTLLAGFALAAVCAGLMIVVLTATW